MEQTAEYLLLRRGATDHINCFSQLFEILIPNIYFIPRILSLFELYSQNAYFGCSSECSTPKEHLKRLAMPTSANENIMPDPKDSHNIEGQPPLYAAAENVHL